MDETRLLLSRLDDLVYKSYCGELEGFGFLNEQEVSVAHNYLSNLKVNHVFYGGYPLATRMYLYLSDDIPDADNICALSVTVKGDGMPVHRDYLGALMGLGINRECVGDIITTSTGAIVFVRNELSQYICQNLCSVGRYSVTVEVYSGEKSFLTSGFSEVEVILTSMRIDNVVTSVCKCSRQKACDYISGDRVFLNYSCVNKPSKTVSPGDIVSIRGFGKFKIGDVLRNTKSGRMVVSVLQYK